ncbi:polysaccharide lyase family 8 super-sandwich domain-containing protein, partial [Lentilactobacillus parabuchneri]|uniref:polysaccharide lyase family 8 super-sandwich domain-containing protein n=1 Tax=Lentilactobacillus parabuchneri TaxID=152331 RepID=UPI00264A49AC
HIDVDDDLTARYVKYQQHKMWEHSNGQSYGSSIISFEAYEEARQAEGIEISTDAVEISEQRSRKLEFTLTPKGINVPDDQIEWSSSDTSIVEVDNQGVIKALNKGTAEITVQIKDTELSDTIPVTVTEENSEYAAMRTKWKERLLGDEGLDEDTDVQNYRQKIIDESTELWETLNKAEDREYLWSKKESDTVSADYTTQFTNIKTLTLGYYDPSSPLFENEEVFTEIINAIEFMIDTKQYDGTYWTGNWWDWQIGSAQPLTDTLILLHDDLIENDYEKLEKFVEPLTLYAEDPKIQWPGSTATGANLTDIAITVLGSAILLEDDSRVDLVKEDVPTVLENVTSGDGLYQDGSLIQHGHFPYNGSYGNELLKGFGRIQTILQDTSWEIEDSNVNNLFNVVDKGYLQLMIDGKMPAMVSGRSISRAPGTNPFTSELETGKETIANLTLIAKFAPDELKNKIHSAIKLWINQSSYFYNFYESPRDFEALSDLKSIMNDDSVSANEPTNIVNVYGSMDRVFQKNEDYSVGISMYSNRVGNYEYGNTENKRGWHTADGMFYLYNDDLTQFDEGYWATIDSYRLPGTTVDTKELADGALTGEKSPQSWVGGSNDGSVASVGMFLDKNNEDMDLVAKKSWFLLDGKVVNLGSGINGTTDASIETIVENRMVDAENTEVVQDESEDAFWIGLNGADTANNLGYVFPNSMTDVEVEQESRSGKYSDINEYFPNDQTYTNDFVKIIKNHGNNVENDNYEYMTVNGKTNEELAEMAKTKEYQVLENTSDIQAIETEKYVMANTWTENQEASFMQVNEPMSVISGKLSDDTYRFTLANPSQDNKNVSFEIDKDITEVVENDPEVSADSNVISLNSEGLKGSSRSITVKVIGEAETDKSELEKLIEANQDKKAEDYTPESWETFSEALESAQAVLADDKATQAEVDEAVERLIQAVEQLEEASEDEETDKTELEETV